MIKACDDTGVWLFVVKQNRHNTTLQRVKQAIRGGRFGRIYLVQVNVFWTRPQEYYDGAGWRGTWGFDGGALMNQAGNYVDLLDWSGCQRTGVGRTHGEIDRSRGYRGAQ